MSRLSLDVFDTFSLFFSWYIKPILTTKNFLVYIQFSFLLIAVYLIKLTNSLVLNLLNPVVYFLSTLKLTSLFSIFLGIKFVLLIALLIFVRGGIPRYRYDFLTKLGWIKTLSLVLAIFLINLLLSYL